MILHEKVNRKGIVIYTLSFFIYIIFCSCAVWNFTARAFQKNIRFREENSDARASIILVRKDVNYEDIRQEIKKCLKSEIWNTVIVNEVYLSREYKNPEFQELVEWAKKQGMVVEEEVKRFGRRKSKWKAIGPWPVNLTPYVKTKTDMDEPDIRDDGHSILPENPIDEADKWYLYAVADALAFSGQAWSGFQLSGKPIILTRGGSNGKSLWFNISQELIKDVLEEKGLSFDVKAKVIHDFVISLNLSLNDSVPNDCCNTVFPNSKRRVSPVVQLIANRINQPILIVNYDQNIEREDILQTICHEGFHAFFQTTTAFAPSVDLNECRSQLENAIKNKIFQDRIKWEFNALKEILQDIKNKEDSYIIIEKITNYLTFHQSLGDQSPFLYLCELYWENLEGSANYVGLKNIYPSFLEREDQLDSLISLLSESDPGVFFLRQGTAQMAILEYLSTLKEDDLSWQQKIFSDEGMKRFACDIIKDFIEGRKK